MALIVTLMILSSFIILEATLPLRNHSIFLFPSGMTITRFGVHSNAGACHLALEDYKEAVGWAAIQGQSSSAHLITSVFENDQA